MLGNLYIVLWARRVLVLAAHTIMRLSAFPYTCSLPQDLEDQHSATASVLIGAAYCLLYVVYYVILAPGVSIGSQVPMTNILSAPAYE